MRKEKSCGALVVRRGKDETEILLIKHNGGHWAFPKGHVEAGESEEQTALREVQEETGLVVKLDTRYREMVTFSPAPRTLKDVVYFAATVISGKETPQLTEVSDVRWVPFSKAEQYITFENDRHLFHKLCEFVTAVHLLD
ncbi:MAG: NUDIX domain-containing protein [Ruminococcaceae bacterium]|nr:NUDIX domain-containing protein [Oscillospiraceae bacterium]